MTSIEPVSVVSSKDDDQGPKPKSLNPEQDIDDGSKSKDGVQSSTILNQDNDNKDVDDQGLKPKSLNPEQDIDGSKDGVQNSMILNEDNDNKDDDQGPKPKSLNSEQDIDDGSKDGVQNTMIRNEDNDNKDVDDQGPKPKSLNSEQDIDDGSKDGVQNTMIRNEDNDKKDVDDQGPKPKSLNPEKDINDSKDGVQNSMIVLNEDNDNKDVDDQSPKPKSLNSEQDNIDGVQNSMIRNEDNDKDDVTTTTTTTTIFKITLKQSESSQLRQTSIASTPSESSTSLLDPETQQQQPMEDSSKQCNDPDSVPEDVEEDIQTISVTPTVQSITSSEPPLPESIPSVSVDPETPYPVVGAISRSVSDVSGKSSSSTELSSGTNSTLVSQSQPIIVPVTKVTVVVTPDSEVKSLSAQNSSPSITKRSPEHSPKIIHKKPPPARTRRSTSGGGGQLVGDERVVKTAKSTQPNKIVYPDDLNPFGDEEESTPSQVQTSTPKQPSKSGVSIKVTIYPTDLNPFGDEEVEAQSNGSVCSRSLSASLNPFGSDDEDQDEEENLSAPSSHSVTPMPSPLPRKSLLNGQRNERATPRSPKGPSKSNRTKKRQAPAPPPSSPSPALDRSQSSDLNQSSISLGLNDSTVNDDCSSVMSSASQSSVSQPRTPTPIPRQSKLHVPPESSPQRSEQHRSSSLTTLHHLPTALVITKPESPPTSTNDLNCSSVSAQIKLIKSKKRPAPPIPAYKRCIKSSIAEMDEELDKIGDELPVVEKRRKELEQWLMDNRFVEDEEPTNNENEDLGKTTTNEDDEKYKQSVLEFIELAKQRCKLARKQKELMYMKREHKLEEAQADIEYRLRMIMSKQDVHKTDSDREDEKELLDRLMEIIDERNDIIENMIRDENREIEEYQLIISKVIPAEPDSEPIQPVVQKRDSFETTHRDKSHKPHQHHSLSSFLKLKKKKNKKDKNAEKVEDSDDTSSRRSSKENTTSSDTSLNGKSAGNNLVRSTSNGDSDAKDPKKDSKKKHFTLSKSTLKKLSPMHAASDLVHFGHRKHSKQQQQQQTSQSNLAVGPQVDTPPTNSQPNN